MPALEVTQLQLYGRKALVRCDFNVPLHDGRIADPARIDASLDTIRYVLGHGGAAVLCSHLGRPRERSPDLSLKPVAEHLSVALGQKVPLAPDCIGEVTLGLVAALKPGGALLLENLRFHLEEEANERDFSHELARGKDLYINDAFGSAHRAHASTVGVTRFLAERAAGFLMMRELEALSTLTHEPARPYIAILGGAKVSDKIGVIRNLMTKVDAILIGGAMAYTFLRARGIDVGQSRVEGDKLQLAGDLMVET
ncbi:MAG: phosphoglycerate kinase, partial [Candidatus Binataceae bacterium]